MPSIDVAEPAGSLSAEEVGDLAQCEDAIGRGITSFIEVGEALARIRDRRLYRGSHSSFAAYCGERWGLSRAHAHRAIASSQVAAILSPTGDKISTESQARELAVLREAWQRAVEAAEARRQAAQVRAARNRSASVTALSVQPPGPGATSGTGEPRRGLRQDGRRRQGRGGGGRVPGTGAGGA